MFGQEISIEGLYFEHRLTITNMLFPMVGCYQTAEDLTQDAYIKVANTEQPQNIQFPRSYLFQTAKNLALDYLRKEKVRCRHEKQPLEELEILEVTAKAANPEQIIASSQQVELFQTLLSALPQQRREMFLLHKVQGWRYDEIAAYFGVSRSTVEKNIRLVLMDCFLVYQFDND